MKKYISLFSLLALFFVGIQHVQSQNTEKKTLDDGTAKKEKQQHYNELANKQKQQSPEHKAKVAMLETGDANSEAKHKLSKIQEFVTTLSTNQQSELHTVFSDLNKNLNSYEGDNSKKSLDAKAALNDEANAMIKKILNEEQFVSYKEYLVKTAKSDK